MEFSDSRMSRYESLVRDISGLVDRDEIVRIGGMRSLRERSDALCAELSRVVDRYPIGVYNGMLHYYNGRYYSGLTWDEFGNLVYDVMRRIGIPDGDYCKAEGMIRVLSRRLRAKALELSSDVMVFRNCVYDFSRGVVSKHSSNFVQFSMADYDYNPSARGYLWDNFLSEVLPIEDYRICLQEFLGSLFVDRHKVRIERMLILKGSGANGKSVIFDTIMGILGRGNVTNFGIDELIGGGNERKRNISKLNGKRLNYASETRKFVIDGGSGTLKAMISGEPMEARPMYGENFTAYDIPLMMINTNHMPELKDFSHGMRRRICMIPFDVTIPSWRQNKTLSMELVSEYPHIFNWLMEGRKRFVNNKYTYSPCTALSDIMDEYQAESTSVLRFMYDMGLKADDALILDSRAVLAPFTVIYERYLKWCIANGYPAEVKSKAGHILIDAGYKRVRKGGGVFYQLYGERAVELQIGELRYKRALREMKDHDYNIRKYTLRQLHDMAESVMGRHGFTRCAVGTYELFEYLGYKFNIVTMMRKGLMDGMYVLENGLYFFNLEMIDEVFRPKYEKRIKEAIIRRQDLRDAKAELSRIRKEELYKDDNEKFSNDFILDEKKKFDEFLTNN